MDVLFNSDYAIISYNKAEGIMYMELRGVIEGEDYRRAFNTLRDIVLEMKVKKVLINQATMKKSSMESKAWLVANWLPNSSKILDFKIRVSLILSKNLFTKIGGEFVVGAARKIIKFDIKTFSDYDEAKKWLNQESKA